MALKCDQKAKEERIKSVRENRSNNFLFVGNLVMQRGRETSEKSFSEVMKGKDSDAKCEEYVQHKHGEQWDLIDVDARKVFANFTPSMIKDVTGINHYGERIKCIDKSNKTAACSSCSEIEDWDHVLLCEQNNNKRKEWEKGLETKLNDIKQHENADEEERGIVKEMVKHVSKYLDNNNDYFTHQ